MARYVPGTEDWWVIRDWHNMVSRAGTGEALARRIQSERQKRGWSQAEVARRMREVGQPLDQAAISKIESVGERARRVDIDEAIAFSRIFDVPLIELVLPPEALGAVVGQRALQEALDTLGEVERRSAQYQEQIRRLAAVAGEEPDFLAALSRDLSHPDPEIADDPLMRRLARVATDVLDALAASTGGHDPGSGVTHG